MILIVRGFLYTVRWDDEIMRQVNVSAVGPGLHRRPRYGAAIITTATLEFRQWINLVFIPIMGASGGSGGDIHCREDEPSHGLLKYLAGAARSSIYVY
jgi:hypothetical protein